MAFLGVPYRILYEAAGLETGLTMVTARILRPDGQTIDGPFTMTELNSPFTGRYVYDYQNDITFPQGDYFAFISSPGDATFTTFRFELYLPFATAAQVAEISVDPDTLTSLSNQVSQLTADVTNLTTLVAALSANSDSLQTLASLIPSLISATVPAFIKGITGPSLTAGVVKDANAIYGKISDDEEGIGEISDDIIKGKAKDETFALGKIQDDGLSFKLE